MSTTSTTAVEGAQPVTGRQMASAIIASCLGWSLDLFDLFILLYVAPVIGAAFFPSDHPTLSLAAVYASFAVTVLMRPIGSAVFGSYADARGRKGAMTLAVVGVGVVTASFGLLPTIHQVGLLAPALFLALRLVQGVFVGGVVASTHTVGTESVPPNWRGFMSGLIGGGGGGLGALLASAVYLVAASLFPGELFAVWGWRFMFFCGLASSFLGFFIFNSLEESPVWKAMDARRAAARAGGAADAARTRSPLRTLFAGEHRRVLLVNLLITAGGGSAYYITSGFMPTLLKVVSKLPNETASLILMAASACAIAASLLVGTLSDRLGRRTMFRLVGAANLVLLPVLFLALPNASGVGQVTLYALALCFLGNATYAPILIFLNERFPTALRASGTGLSWNLGFALGGTMPTWVSLASGSPANLPATLAVFAGLIMLVFLIGSLVIPETRGRFE